MHAMKHLKVSLMLSNTYGQIARYNWPPFMCLINVFVLGGFSFKEDHNAVRFMLLQLLAL